MADDRSGRSGGADAAEGARLAESLRAEADAALFAGLEFHEGLRAGVRKRLAAGAPDVSPGRRFTGWIWAAAAAAGAVAVLVLAVTARWSPPYASRPQAATEASPRVALQQPAPASGAQDQMAAGAAPRETALQKGEGAYAALQSEPAADGGPVRKLPGTGALRGAVTLAGGGDEFAPGAAVGLRLLVRNEGQHEVVLGGEAAEMVVAAAGRPGEERRQGSLAALRGRRLRPGEELVAETTVRAPDVPGWYGVSVKGLVATEEGGAGGATEYAFRSPTRLFLVREGEAAAGTRAGEFRVSRDGVDFVVERVSWSARETRVLFRIPGLGAPAAFRLTLERDGAPGESDLELAYSGDASGVRGEAVFNPLPARFGALRVVLRDLSGVLNGEPVSLPGPWVVTVR